MGSVAQARLGRELELNRNPRPATQEASHRSFLRLCCSQQSEPGLEPPHSRADLDT